MSDPILLSDEESVAELPETPMPSLAKHFSKTDPDCVPAVVVIDDDPSPCKTLKNNSGSSIFVEVPETPASEDAIAKTSLVTMNYHSIAVAGCTSGALFFDSEGIEHRERPLTETDIGDRMVLGKCNDLDSPFSPSPLRFMSVDGDREPLKAAEPKSSNSGDANEKECTKSREQDKQYEAIKRKKISKEEKERVREELKLKRKLDKLQKVALKDEERQQKKAENQKKKWETGKFALKSVVAEIDAKVIEQGSVGGHLLTKLSEKSIGYRIVSNVIDRSIIWRMNIPEEFAQLDAKEVRYVLVVYDAEEFCDLVSNDSLLDHIARVRRSYPSNTICYLTNRLMAYVNKRERESYKSGKTDGCWSKPRIDEAMSVLTTHYHNVHYRHCRDEAEVAEHIVGLTCSLASCQYRTKLTKLSVNANGFVVPKDCVDRAIIKKNTWLKALVAIPKVQPRFAMAIWKKYPTMKSLLVEYMDADKSVHEKEFLLQDLTVEGLTGNERRVGAVCSKRIYRILMASNGDILTDDVEDGADHFVNLPS